VPSDSLSRFVVRARQLPALLLAANVVFLLTSPTLTGKAVSAFGALVGFVLVAGPRLSASFATAMDREFPRSVRMTMPGILLVALLPALSFVRQPQIAFWRVDGPALIVVAWLTTLFWLIARTRRTQSAAVPGVLPLVSPLFLLFITWSAVFWLMLVWDVGVSRAVFAKSAPDRLSLSFELWETYSPRDHLFMIWYSREDFARRAVYPNHLHPYVFLMYGSTKLVQMATGLPLYVGRNMTPFVIAALGVVSAAVVMTRARIAWTMDGLKSYAMLFLLLGLIVSQSHYWTSLYVVNFDNIFPLIAYFTAIVWATATPKIGAENAGIVVLSTVLFAAFGWAYTPFLILALWCYFGRLSDTVARTVARNQALVRASIAGTSMFILVYGLPRVLVAARGYATTDSPYLFRSGLDGDVRYFRHLAQAVFQPNWTEARTPWTLVFPAFVPLVAGLAWSSRLARFRTLAQFGFLAAPYFFSLALFPQAVSIHPYLYDQLLVIPAVLTGATSCLVPTFQRRIRGPYALAAIALTLMLLMSNFIAIAQGIRRVVAL
jgi:hypothetical protein